MATYQGLLHDWKTLSATRPINQFERGARNASAMSGEATASWRIVKPVSGTRKSVIELIWVFATALRSRDSRRVSKIRG